MNISSLVAVGSNQQDKDNTLALRPLANALQNNNLTAARTAFARLQKSGSNRGPLPPNQVNNANPMSTIGEALQVGDLGTAKKEFVNMISPTSTNQKGSSAGPLPGMRILPAGSGSNQKGTETDPLPGMRILPAGTGSISGSDADQKGSPIGPLPGDRIYVAGDPGGIDLSA
ncbi:MAG: hypothetical protein GC165_11455 [Armatimonadetes bacterium]|nr:hypothetical protein [Armatimonadota bacterium]MBS1728261.1 hypothetical protein [Armatimonadota bacterium]